MANKKKPVKDGDTRYNEYHREYMEKKREESRDIGELPPVENPKRRKECEHDLVKFCNTYLSDYFFRPWSAAQLEIAKNVEKVIQTGGSQAIAHKRRGAKTTICTGGLLWAAVYGKHMYSYFVAASSEATLDAKEFFEIELMENDMLCADFPEICIPIRKTEGIKQRNPTYHGNRCNIEFTGNTVRLPTMRIHDKNGNPIRNEKGKYKHYPSSSALIKFISIASTVARGRGIAFADRGSIRPSLALVDDPQNDGSAKSEGEIGKLDDFVRKTIAPMSGYDRSTNRIKSPSILLTVTCIQPNDFAVRYTDRSKNPDYNGLVFRRFAKMPNPMPQLWQQYKELWAEDGGARSKPCMERKATQFYLANRKAMDAGFEVDDENDYEEFQVSAIQYGMDVWCENEKGFYCEHQNDPEAALAAVEKGLAPGYITREKTLRLNPDLKKPSSRRWVPENTEFLAGFIDAGIHYLNYEIVAFGKGFSFAHVVDFGYFPDQKRHRVRKHDFGVDMQKFYQGGSPGEIVSWGVRDCLTAIFEREYFDHNGNHIDIHRPIDYRIGREEQQARFLAMIGVDATDAHQTMEPVWSGIAQFNATSRDDFPVMNRALPCFGDKTRSKPMRNFPLDIGEWQRGRDRFRSGDGDWIEYPRSRRALIEKYAGQVHSCLLWEANPYRTLRNTAWLTTVGTNGSQTLFDDLPEALIPYAEQQCAMVSSTKWLIGLEYDAWELRKPAIYDKEFFDTNSGSWMIASYVGLNPEFGITVEVPEAVHQKGVNWLEKIKTKDESKVPNVRGRSRR